jgi:magnesium chelatase family protein
MPAKIFSATLLGTEAKIIEVEVNVAAGIPNTIIVGLADAAIRESKERVRACLRNSASFKYPLGRVSINLAPANIFKYGSQFDLAIALGILLASSQAKFFTAGRLFLAELSLDGNLSPVNGVLAMILAAKQCGFSEVFLPVANINEASLVSGIELIPCRDLKDVFKFLNEKIKADIVASPVQYAKEQIVDFSEIIDQDFAKRALIIAAAGGHNILLSGIPGTGKTMLAQSLISILPEPSSQQILEVVKIHGISGNIIDNKINVLPFRNPHHSISMQAFVGGGTVPKPGEISLAHNGILFLDEFPEFPRNIIECLRQPLEHGTIKISRHQGSYIFPANFIFVAAQNPCPCGYYNQVDNKCICSAGQLQRYKRKISGPILDRIDLHVNIRRANLRKIYQKSKNSQAAKEQVALARAIQQKRFASFKLNSRMNAEEIKIFCSLDKESRKLIYQAEEKFAFSARTYFKLLKVARSIADLEACQQINHAQIAEALSYKIFD